MSACPDIVSIQLARHLADEDAKDRYALGLEDFKLRAVWSEIIEADEMLGLIYDGLISLDGFRGYIDAALKKAYDEHLAESKRQAEEDRAAELAAWSKNWDA